MGYQVCKRCVMDNVSDDSIIFMKDGTCNYCNDVLARKNKEYFPNEEGKKKLEDVISKIKCDCKNDEYDCMVGVSGGLDSSYVLYMGYKLGLRMIAVHIDDGYDTETAKENIQKLCKKTKTRLINVKPDKKQYNDLILAFIKAGVRELCVPQDNILHACLEKYAREHHIKYTLSGANFAHECILERGEDNINACDKKHIKAIHKKYGKEKIDKLPLISLWQRYIFNRYSKKVKSIKPLNYIDYDFSMVLQTLEDFCGYEYYGGKHYESILTRFLQCYYLPVKFKKDKRKSHFSSLIVNNQMEREEAIKKLQTNSYIEEGMWEKDVEFIAKQCGIKKEELMDLINQKPHKHEDYPQSVLNKMAPIARKFRRFLE